jgi:hypothetical protein
MSRMDVFDTFMYAILLRDDAGGGAGGGAGGDDDVVVGLVGLLSP